MTKETPTAVVCNNQERVISLTWLVPLVAIILTSFLFIKWKLDQGPLITITFDEASGLTTDSPILYRGTVVGQVNNITLNSNATGVRVSARLNSTSTMLAKENSEWWIVRPSVSLQGIQGLDTILAPKYIQVLPGTGKATYSFIGLPEAVQPNGKLFVLISSSADAITVGAPLFYRGIEVGMVTSVKLANDASTVHILCHVQERYAPIIRTNTKFWNISGIHIDANLLGIDLKAGPVTSWIKGGISLATPDNVGDIVPNGFSFTLEDKVNDDWIEWSPEIDLSQNTETK